MKTWVNIFRDYYQQDQVYVSKGYATEEEAKSGVRNHMRTRYITTINLAQILKGHERQTSIQF